jgi:hypothetical protein
MPDSSNISLRERFIDVDVAPRAKSMFEFLFLDQENLLVLEYRSPDVELRRDITRFSEKCFVDKFLGMN